MLTHEFATPVTGPAYGRATRLFATATVAALALLSWRVLSRTEGWADADALWLLGLSGLAVLGSWWQMMSSTTTLDSEGIRQSGWIEKRMSWDEVSFAKLLSPRLAPRLVIKARLGRPRAFYAGNAELGAAFARVAAAYSGR